MDINASQKLGTLLKYLATAETGRSAQTYTGLNPEKGTAVMYRVKSHLDGRLAKLLHFVSMFPERAKIRTEIKALLKENGVQITDGIKKALPKATSLGDSTELAKQIQASLMNKASNISDAKELLSLFQLELYQFNWSNKNGTQTFMRENSASQASLAILLNTQQVKDECDAIAKEAVRCGRDLLRGKNLSADHYDRAMLEIYKTTLESVCKIKLPDSFTDLANEMTNLINQVAGEMSGHSSNPTAENISGDMKKLVTASMMLRTYSAALSDSLSVEMKNLSEEIKSANPHAEIPENFTGFNIGQYVMKLFSGKTVSAKEFQGKKTAAQFPKFTEFLADPEKNNLKKFSSLNTLQAAITESKGLVTH